MFVALVAVDQPRLVQTFLRLARQNTPPRRERSASEIAYEILTNLFQ